MKWLDWFENNKEAYARDKYGRGYASLTHHQVLVLQDEMASVWMDEWSMFSAIKTSQKDYMGFSWFKVYKNGKFTGNSYNSLDKSHAIRMHKQFDE